MVAVGGALPVVAIVPVVLVGKLVAGLSLPRRMPGEPALLPQYSDPSIVPVE